MEAFLDERVDSDQTEAFDRFHNGWCDVDDSWNGLFLTGSLDESLTLVRDTARDAADLMERVCASHTDSRIARDGLRSFLVHSGASRSSAFALLEILSRAIEAASATLDSTGRASGPHYGYRSSLASETDFDGDRLRSAERILVDWKAINVAATGATHRRVLDESGEPAVLISRLATPAVWPTEAIED